MQWFQIEWQHVWSCQTYTSSIQCVDIELAAHNFMALMKSNSIRILNISRV